MNDLANGHATSYPTFPGVGNYLLLVVERYRMETSFMRLYTLTLKCENTTTLVTDYTVMFALGLTAYTGYIQFADCITRQLAMAWRQYQQ